MSNANVRRKRQMGWKTKIVSLVVVLLAFLIGSCIFLDDLLEETSREEPILLEDITTGRKVLAVTNVSAKNANLSFSINRSAITNDFTENPPESAVDWASDGPRMGTESATRFNANPPPFRKGSSRLVESPTLSLTEYTVGTSKKFWVSPTDKEAYTQIDTTLLAQGTYGNVWVHDDRIDGSGKKATMTTNEAQALATEFDKIYPLATNLLGYEYGGNPAETDERGGVDGDIRIQILIYDIDDDYASTRSSSRTVGYFHGKDEFTQQELIKERLPNLKTNLAEIFYIDIEFLIGSKKSDGTTLIAANPATIYSTLVHEFQHMIHFNQKALRLNKASAVWYNEMLSALAEDVISPLIQIPINTKGHPIGDRIPLFLASYSEAGVTQWLEGNNVLKSYAAVFAFGAYLIRNYGGPVLIQKMLANGAVDEASITQALASIPGNITFEAAMERFAEALLYSTSKTAGGITGKMSFDRDTTSTIKGTDYMAHGFDIWKIQQGDSETLKGPKLYSYPPGSYPLPGNSVRLHALQDNTYGELTGSVEIRPDSAQIDVKVVYY